MKKDEVIETTPVEYIPDAEEAIPGTIETPEEEVTPFEDPKGDEK